MTTLHPLAALVRAQAAAGQTATPERAALAVALRAALEAGAWRKPRAAEALGIPRSTLDRWLELAGLTSRDLLRGRRAWEDARDGTVG